MGGNRMEKRIRLHSDKSADSVHQYLYRHPAVGGLQQGGEQLKPRLVGVKVEGGQDNLLLGRLGHGQPQLQGLLVVRQVAHLLASGGVGGILRRCRIGGKGPGDGGVA